ncbi:hypothetical protein R2R70_21135, partial [Cobetia sp. SIMBA_158]
SSLMDQNLPPSGWLSPVYNVQKNNDAPSSEFTLNIDIDVGLELVDITSKHHRINFNNPAFGQYKIALNDTNGANRDFVLAFKPLQK